MNPLTYYRKQANLTQTQLANITGIPQPSIARIESGARQIGAITLETAVKLAKALGIHAEDLLDYERSKTMKANIYVGHSLAVEGAEGTREEISVLAHEVKNEYDGIEVTVWMTDDDTWETYSWDEMPAELIETYTI